MFSSNYNVIRKSPLFSGMDDGQLSASLSLLSAGRAEYCKNSLIISAGSRMYRFALVLSGVVQVSFTDIDGNEVLMASVSAGDTFGESLCWLGREEIPVSVTAQTDVCLLWLIPDAIKNESTPLIAAKSANSHTDIPSDAPFSSASLSSPSLLNSEKSAVIKPPSKIETAV